jgi:hypothetical protein
LSEIPTDIQQIFVTADELAPEQPEPAATTVGKKKSHR